MAYSPDSPSRPRQILISPVFWECWRLMTLRWIILLEVPSAEESSAIQGHPFLPRGCYCCCHLADKSCLTLCDPTDCSVPGSSVHGISQTKILEWVAISFFRGSSQSRDQNPCLLHREADSLPLNQQGSPTSPASNYWSVSSSQGPVPLPQSKTVQRIILAPKLPMGSAKGLITAHHSSTPFSSQLPFLCPPPRYRWQRHSLINFHHS